MPQKQKSVKKAQELTHIVVKGAREHNLKNVDIQIPKKKLVVFTGVSGSGKSSLAFDTIFAEGQRRYVESLSSYARQFLGQMDKPKFETIKGLSPTVAIEQKAASKNPRSTVGTITEIYDYLRVLFSRIGIQHCLHCGKKVGRGDSTSMVEHILTLPTDTKIIILAPVVENRKGEHKDFFDSLRKEGFVRVRIDGVIQQLEDVQTLAKHKKHNIEVVLDRLVIKSGKNFKKRLTDSVELALKLGRGQLITHVIGHNDLRMSEARSCCGHAYPDLEPPHFSFNSPLGMCDTCNGLGTMIDMDEEKLIASPHLSIRQGAVLPWKNYFKSDNDSLSWKHEKILAMKEQWGLDLDKPWSKLPQRHKNMLLHGSRGKKKLTLSWMSTNGHGEWSDYYEGLIPTLMRRYKKTQSDKQKTWYQQFMSSKPCSTCQGKRLKDEILHVLVHKQSIHDVTSLTIKEAHHFFKDMQLSPHDKLVVHELIKEIKNRLHFMLSVGLEYLDLNRKGPTLSGGEAQRIRLASQVGSELTGVLYVLDEPSIGLHQRDNKKLLETLMHLRDIGNSLIVVEHDQETIEVADWVVDIGPGAGHLGGNVVFSGTPKQLLKDKHSLTGQYLSGQLELEVPTSRRAAQERSIEIICASANNLQNIDVKIPLGLLTVFTGVSGAGKSTLINQILYPALARQLYAASTEVGAHQEIRGIEYIDKVINIDQKPIGRTPRSNPATYTKVFDLIRDVFSCLPEAKLRGYKKGRFSFNVKGGRCESCQGDGYNIVEMHFLADVLVPCDVCKGKRFNSSTLEIRYKTQSIADVLDMSVVQARDFFSVYPNITKILNTLVDVGLSYIKLGQAATTLSGGEAQRIKLARELAKRQTGKTLYLLDEPTTGLHFDDINKLLHVLQDLVDRGNTIVVIEHNLDVIKSCDWIIDLGPEGGQAGGQIVAQGTPEQLCKARNSYTGKYLKQRLKTSSPPKRHAINQASMHP